MKKTFGLMPDGRVVSEFTLANKQGMIVRAMDYGCTITSLMMPDRQGKTVDIVLGFNSLEGYLQSKHYIGCVIGRYANRIAHGRFSMDGREYLLATNLHPHHLHGGVSGFDKKLWSAVPYENENGCGIRFSYYSLHLEEGYPGNVHVDVDYFLAHDNTLTFQYEAITDKATVINLTQHSYFNLNGGISTIHEHHLQLNAEYFLPVNETLVPTGEIERVDNTPFDFRNAKQIGQELSAENIQINRASGYDHTWVLKKEKNILSYAATLYDETSGRSMEVYTEEPGMQLYTANHLEEFVPGKNGRHLGPYAGVCLETQHFPDSPNQPGFPSVVLLPGEMYKSKTILKFSAA